MSPRPYPLSGAASALVRPPGLEEMDDILELCSQSAGGRDAFWERPFVTFQYCPVVSPLTMDVAATERLMRFTEWGVPSFGIPSPNAGMTAPLDCAP